VPTNLKGEFGLRVKYDTAPFEATFKTRKLTLK